MEVYLMLCSGQAERGLKSLLGILLIWYMLRECVSKAFMKSYKRSISTNNKPGLEVDHTIMIAFICFKQEQRLGHLDYVFP